MKKSDLITGMRVKTKNGYTYIVVRDYDTANYGHQDILFAGIKGFMTGDSYDDDLLCEGLNGYHDIAEIYTKPADSNFLDIESRGTLLWKRPEPREMTLAEIEYKLGYPVKIIKED